MFSYISLLCFCIVSALWCELANCSDCNESNITGGFSDDLLSCPDFENKYIDVTKLKLTALSGSKEGEGKMGLSGEMCVKQELPDTVEIEMRLYKEDTNGNNMMWAAVMNMCETIKQSPWDKYMGELGMSSCPIKAKCHDCKDIELMLGFAEQYMEPENIGSYTIELKLLNGIEELACILLGVSIFETQDGCE